MPRDAAIGRRSIPDVDAATVWQYKIASGCLRWNRANAWNASPQPFRGGLVPLFAPTIATMNASRGTFSASRALSRSPASNGRNTPVSTPCGTYGGCKPSCRISVSPYRDIAIGCAPVRP